MKWRKKFLGLLPEVERRRLWEKNGFGSIYEFAAKLGGASREQVKRVLSLEEKFQDTLELKKLLIDGEVSINKLARVASVANKENGEFWADQVKALLNRAIETLVRDVKQNQASQNVVHVHKSSGDLRLDNDITEQLLDSPYKKICTFTET